MSEYIVLRDVLILSSILISDSCLSDLSSPKCVVEWVVHRFLPSNFQLFSDELERNSIGLHLGDIYVDTPTCADDLALLSSSKVEFVDIIRCSWIDAICIVESRAHE
jgi:hypothetical protein